MNISKAIALILFLILTSCIGIAVGRTVGSYLDSPQAVRWVLLKTPLEKAIRIYGVELDEIYVESATGKIYYCYIRQLQDCWIESPPRKTSVSRMPPCYTSDPIGDPPSQVIDRAGVCMPSPVYLVNYALTSDGNVWLWRYSPKTFILGIDGIVPGCFLGLLAGVIIWVHLWNRAVKIAEKLYWSTGFCTANQSCFLTLITPKSVKLNGVGVQQVADQYKNAEKSRLFTKCFGSAGQNSRQFPLPKLNFSRDFGHLERPCSQFESCTLIILLLTRQIGS